MQIGGSRNQLQRCYHVRWFDMEMRNASAIKRRASWWNRFARHEEEVNASQAISLVDCIIEARKIDELSVSYGNCRSKWCRGGSALNRLIGFVACVIQRLTIDMVITCNCAGTRVKDEEEFMCQPSGVNDASVHAIQKLSLRLSNWRKKKPEQGKLKFV